MSDSLHDLIAAELAEPVDPRAAGLAAAVAAQYPSAARAVLFYGSCLRERQLDGLMLDFYLIVSDYEAAYGKGWLARANRLIPPNVFPFEADGLACKYAVLSEADFVRLCGMEADNVSVWARFAQPLRLAWAADGNAREQVAATVAEAAVTLFQHAIPMIAPDADHGGLAIWKRGFELTYAAELRAERVGRGGSIIDSDPARYERVGKAALAEIARRQGVGANGEVVNAMSSARMARRWRGLQRHGKRLTLLRLAKASATFAGGIDYLAWKINRHAGTKIAIRPWQRRWPIIGSLSLLPKLLAKGAVR
ncbi:hypothetical protein DMC47_40820 [Nostoc sp. 3335mG]|nr:hypothetical protein DMC47_40820 [Nostoc sp. 3335mG]